MRIATLLLVMLLAATSAWGADSLYMYGKAGREYYPVDTARILVKWAPYAGEFGGSGYLSAYPSISPTTWEANKIDAMVLHGLTGSYNFQSVVNQLRSDPNVESVNEVLVISKEYGLYLYFGDHVVCQFPASTSRAFVDSLCAANHLVVESESQYISRQFVLKRLPGATLSTRELANYLHDLPSTTWAQPDWIGNGIEFGYSVNDEYFHNTQWNIRKTIDYKSTTNYGAWELTRGSSSITVAVLDRGMEPHEDFDTSKWDPGIDFTPPEGGIDFDPSPITPEPANIIDAHGMAVLGIIAAAHNNPVIVGNEQGGTIWSSTAGMAPMTRIIPLRIIDTLGRLVTQSKVASAINYAVATGADVINCSWGYPLTIPLAVDTAINNALTNGRNGKGCIVVVASGNIPFLGIAYPATKDSVIAVGAIGKNDYVHNYSSFGPMLDLVAPSAGDCGKNGETCQDTSNSFLTTDRADAIGYNTKDFGGCFPSQDNDYVCTFNGTSAAAPAVSGEVALLLALDSTLTREQVIDIVKKSAHKKLAWGTLTPSDSTFYGQGRASGVRALCTVRRGDCNASGTINVVDVNYRSAYLFSGGPAPFPDMNFGDANCSGSVNVTDIGYLTNYLFRGGPPPAKPCTVFLPE